MIRAENLRHDFGGFVLDVERLEIETGRYGVLLGPSGSGKSLLLKALAGLHRPQEGRIFIAGREATPLPPERRGVGLVFQEPSLFPHYSVRGNIAYGLRAAGGSRAEKERSLEELAGSMGLSPLLDRRVQALSGGEAQKVTLARALATRPRVLLLDEPLGQVDRHQRVEIQALLKEVTRRFSLTVLHVTHDGEEAAALAEVCAVMLGGRVLQCAGWSEMQSRPACPFVAGFLQLQTAGGVARPDGCQEGCRGAVARCDLPAARDTR